MGKKFKGKICAYCANHTATTEDHIFSREFFLVEHRHNLPKAPACSVCNNKKAKYEHYLTAVLPFGARHDHAIANLTSNVPGRLTKNRKLKNKLSESINPMWLREQQQGLYQQTSSISFDGAQLEQLLKFVARGLTWHHWRTYIGRDYHARVLFLPEALDSVWEQQVNSFNVARRTVETLGEGTVRYMGIQAIDPPELTIWGITMYGGVILYGEQRQSSLSTSTVSRWWIVTGPQSVADTIDRSLAT